MLGKLGVWSLGVVALFGVIGFAKTSADLRNVREAAQVHALTYAAKQELRQALSERDLARQQADESTLRAAELRREAEKVDAMVAALAEATSKRDNLRLEEARLAEALAEKRNEMSESEAMRQKAEAMVKEAEAARQAAQEEVREARLQVASLQRESQDFETSVAERRREAESRLASIERRVEDLARERSALVKTVESLRIDHAALTLDLEKAKERHDELVAENDNLTAAVVARASEKRLGPDRSLTEPDRSPSATRREAKDIEEAKGIEEADIGLADSVQDAGGSTVDVDWAALGAIPLPPRRPGGLRGAMTDGAITDPAEQDVAPTQVRRPASAAGSPRTVQKRRTAARRSERAPAPSGSSRIAASQPATLALPSALLPATPAIGTR